MVELSPIAIGFLIVMLGFVLFMYLFLRRTLSAFRKGQSEGRNR
jgi:hypothetical protein